MAQLGVYADCSPRCRSIGHADELAGAVTQRAGEEQLMAWLARHCHAPGRCRDSNGRTLVHMAASTGQTKLLHWLLTYKDGSVNAKDAESGYSALHRAMLHGHIKTIIHLLQNGANLFLVDNNGLTVLDHAVLDRPLHMDLSLNAPVEVYVWGTNCNYNLGLGNNATRNNPDMVEQFRRQNVSVKKVLMQKFHSAFLTRNGQVLTCGHGRGGRLGHGSETMQLTPRAVQLPACSAVSLGVDHSLFLTEDGGVYSCGENTYRQLGHSPPPPRLLAPALLTQQAAGGAGKLPPAIGIAAGRYHSVLWSESNGIYTWGLNAGQLGHLKGDTTVILPKMVPALSGKDTKISKVAVSDGATVVLTAKGEVVALSQYAVKKLGIRQHSVQHMEVIGGHLDSGVNPGCEEDIDFKLVVGGGINLRVYLLSKSGRITVWEEGKENSFIPCLFSVARSPPVIIDLAIHREGMVLIGQDGVAWSTSHATAAGNFKTTSKSQTSAVVLKLKRIQHIHRAVGVSCDPKGRNFSVLQVSPYESLTEVPDVSPSEMRSDMERLLDEASELDPLCDAVCHVGEHQFPVHRYIVASGSESMRKQLNFAASNLEDTNDDTAEDEISNHSNLFDNPQPLSIKIQDVDPAIFQQILKYVYTKTCDLLKEGPCNVRLSSPVGPKESSQHALNNPDIIDVNPNPNEVSAFSAYQQHRNMNNNSHNIVTTAFINGNNREGVISGRSKKKRNGRRSESEGNNCGSQMTGSKPENPLLALQECAKTLGVYGLAKQTECFRFTDGNIVRKSVPPVTRLEFSPTTLEELCDLIIECEDGEEKLAHKCILSARSEYFRGMFSSCWIESGKENRLKLPVKMEYIEAILEFLYRDDCRMVRKSEDVEFVSNILVLADQFLLTRLKEICECQLSRLMTLKNLTEMLEFSELYQANQLKSACLQFISLNLGELLESRALDLLDEAMLDLLDQYYQNVYRNGYKCSLSATSGYPTKEDIESEFRTAPLTFAELEGLELASQSAKTKQNRHNSGDRRKSPRPRRTSTETSGSDSEDGGGGLASDVERISLSDFDIEENSTKSVQSTPAKIERDTSFFSALLASPNQAAPAGGQTSPSEGSPSSHAPDTVSILASKKIVNGTGNERPDHVSQSVSNGHKTPESAGKSKKFPKMSQKERKRQQISLDTAGNQADEACKKSAETTPKSGETRTPWSGWATPSSQPTPSLSDIMLTQTKYTNPKSPAAEADRPRRVSESEGAKATESPWKATTWRKIDLSNIDSELKSKSNLAGEKSKGNPWKLPEQQVTANGSPSGPGQFPTLLPATSGRLAQLRQTSFSEIMAEDVKEKEIQYRVSSKPLHLTQIEEKAIQELRLFYNADGCKDEVITVHRVESGIAATPIWKRAK